MDISNTQVPIPWECPDIKIDRKVKCLVCEQDIDQDQHGLVYGGGFVFAEFHFGSCLDQCKGFAQMDHDKTHLGKLIGSDQIEGYICDACFERKQHLFRGFRKITHQSRKETTCSPPPPSL